MEKREDEWRAELDGDPYELSELRWLLSRFNSPLYSIVKIGRKYYLKASRFEKLIDPRVVLEEAEKLIPIIKSIAKLKSRSIDYHAIRIVAVIGGKTHTVFSKAITQRMKFWTKNGKCYLKSGDNVLEGEDFSGLEKFGLDMSHFEIPDYTSKENTSLHKERRYESYINQFNEWIDGNYISETFSYFADDEPSWTSLWKTYEQIKYDIDGNLDDDVSPEKSKLTRYHWVEEDKLKKFKKAANHPDAEGGSRHSSAYHLNRIEEKIKKSEKPREFWIYKTQIRAKSDSLMSLREANILIKHLFKSWYELKLLEFRLFYFAGIAKYLTKKYNLHCFSRAPIPH
jgi:hypothetical protein